MLASAGLWQLCFLLSLLGLGPVLFCASNEVREFEQPAEIHGAHAILRFVTVFTADGERTTVWRTSELGTVWWLTDPERLAFVAPLSGSPAYVAGDLGSGQLTRLYEAPKEIDGLPATSSVPDSWPAGWRLTDAGVRFRGHVVLPDRGFEFKLWPSPSRRWIVITERQPDSSAARYLIGPDGKDLQLLELVIGGPIPGPDKQRRSPDGRWVAERGPDGLVLRGVDDESIALPVGTGLPAWAPDSSALATLNERGIVVARPDRSIRQLVWGCCSLRVDEWTVQGIVYVAGNYGGTTE